MKDIIVLGIESSCDETSVSVVKNGREVLSNVINSQIDIHTIYRWSCTRNSIKMSHRSYKPSNKTGFERSKPNIY